MTDLNIAILLTQICLTGMISIWGLFAGDSPFIWWSSLITAILYISALYSLNSVTSKDTIAEITSWIVLLYSVYCGFFAIIGVLYHETIGQVFWWLYYIAAMVNICMGLYNL